VLGTAPGYKRRGAAEAVCGFSTIRSLRRLKHCLSASGRRVLFDWGVFTGQRIGTEAEGLREAEDDLDWGR